MTTHTHIHTRTLSKKTKTLKLARQASGTLSKVTSMIEEDIYCPEIIQQVDSTIGLLRSARKELLEGHLDTCVLKQLRDNKSEAVKELLKIYDISN